MNSTILKSLFLGLRQRNADRNCDFRDQFGEEELRENSRKLLAMRVTESDPRILTCYDMILCNRVTISNIHCQINVKILLQVLRFSMFARDNKLQFVNKSALFHVGG